MLYLLNTAQLAIQWWEMQSIFVDRGETRNTIFTGCFFAPYWAGLVTTGCTAATSALADGLLVSTISTIHFRFSHLKLGKIWRCFYVWNRSLLAISLPFFLLVAEIGEISLERTRRPNLWIWFLLKGIYTSWIIIDSLPVKLAPSGQGMILNILLASGYFLSLSSTISSTLLIAYRIYNSFSHQGNHSKKRFLHIVDVLVQSAAAYSLALLVIAIATVVITSGNHFTLPMFAVINYEGVALLFFISVCTFGVQILGNI